MIYPKSRRVSQIVQAVFSASNGLKIFKFFYPLIFRGKLVDSILKLINFLNKYIFNFVNYLIFKQFKQKRLNNLYIFIFKFSL